MSPYWQSIQDGRGKRPVFPLKKPEYPTWKEKYAIWISGATLEERQSEAQLLLSCLPVWKADELRMEYHRETKLASPTVMWLWKWLEANYGEQSAMKEVTDWQNVEPKGGLLTLQDLKNFKSEFERCLRDAGADFPRAHIRKILLAKLPSHVVDKLISQEAKLAPDQDAAQGAGLKCPV